MSCACNKTDNLEDVMARARQTLGEKVAAEIDRYRAGEMSDSRLISVLHVVQSEYGYLSRDHLQAVAQLMQIPAARVTGVATFYHFFRLQPSGRHVISICLGTACYVKGADRVAQKLKDELGIDFGETTSDGMFSLESTRCLGTCGLAPVMTVDEDVHSQVTPDRIPGILERYIKAAGA